MKIFTATLLSIISVFIFSVFALAETESFTAEQEPDAPKSAFILSETEKIVIIKDNTNQELFSATMTVDLNGDNETTSSDARLILRHGAELEFYTGDLESVDVTGDGTLNAIDARLVLRYAADLDKYYFFEDGSAVSGIFRTTDNKTVIFAAYGTVENGFTVLNGNTYYCENGFAVTGAKTINSVLHYFDNDGKGATGEYTVSGKKIYFENGVSFTGYKTVNGKSLYYVNGQPANGKYTVNGVTHLFENGVSFTGYKTVNGKNLYYINGQPANGKYTVNGVTYVFENGVSFTGYKTVNGKNIYYVNGQPANGKYTVNGVTHLFENGVRFTGYKTVNGKNIYYVNGQPANGKYTVSGVTHVFENGVSFTGYKTVNGKKVYYANGIIAHGLTKISSDTYYFSNGVMLQGWQMINNEYYHFDRATGKLRKNTTVDGIKVDANGKAQKTAYNTEKIKTFIKARNIMLRETNTTDTVAQKKEKCFRWVMSCPYKQYRKVGASMKYSGWEMKFANDIFDNGKGCCGSTSAAFAFLAVECGSKNVYFCDDGVSTGGHAWVIMDGNNRVYDVVFAKSKGFSKNYDAAVSDYRKTPPRKTYIGG